MASEGILSRIFVAPVRDRVLAPFGAYIGRTFASAGYTMVMTAEAFVKIPSLFTWRNFCEFLRQCYLSGIQSLPVVLLVGLFIGMVLALQSGLLEKGAFSQESGTFSS